MNKLGTWIHRIVEWGTVISLSGMILVVAIQVVARMTPGLSAPSWTEEMARFLFIYSIAFGVGVGVREKAFVKLDLLEEWMPAKAHSVLQIFIQLGVVLFAGLISFYAVQFAINGAGETSPSMGVSMAVAFFSVFIMMISIAGYSIEQMIQSCRSLRKP